MNNISDFEAHKRDEEYDRIHGDSDWNKYAKCPVHHVPMIAGQGWVDLVTKEHHFEPYGPGGKCPECMRLQIAEVRK